MSSPKDPSTEKFITNNLTAFKAVNFNKEATESKSSILDKTNSNKSENKIKNLIMPKK